MGASPLLSLLPAKWTLSYSWAKELQVHSLSPSLGWPFWEAVCQQRGYFSRDRSEGQTASHLGAFRRKGFAIWSCVCFVSSSHSQSLPWLSSLFPTYPNGLIAKNSLHPRKAVGEVDRLVRGEEGIGCLRVEANHCSWRQKRWACQVPRMEKEVGWGVWDGRGWVGTYSSLDCDSRLRQPMWQMSQCQRWPGTLEEVFQWWCFQCRRTTGAGSWWLGQTWLPGHL